MKPNRVLGGLLGAMLMFCFSGCASHHVARLPGETGGIPSPEDEARTLAVGDGARVSLKNGETISGEVTDVSSQSVTIEQSGYRDWEERSCEKAEIEKLEYIKGPSPLPVLLGFVALLAAFSAKQLSEMGG